MVTEKLSPEYRLQMIIEWNRPVSMAACSFSMSTRDDWYRQVSLGSDPDSSVDPDMQKVEKSLEDGTPLFRIGGEGEPDLVSPSGDRGNDSVKNVYETVDRYGGV